AASPGSNSPTTCGSSSRRVSFMGGDPVVLLIPAHCSLTIEHACSQPFGPANPEEFQPRMNMDGTRIRRKTILALTSVLSVFHPCSSVAETLLPGQSQSLFFSDFASGAGSLPSTHGPSRSWYFSRNTVLPAVPPFQPMIWLGLSPFLLRV